MLVDILYLRAEHNTLKAHTAACGNSFLLYLCRYIPPQAHVARTACSGLISAGCARVRCVQATGSNRWRPLDAQYLAFCAAPHAISHKRLSVGCAVFVVVQAAEVLPHDVLAPANDQFFVAQIKAVFEIQQAGHQAYGQFGAPSIAATCAQ